jgi:Flp pilus assembly protein CpaB
MSVSRLVAWFQGMNLRRRGGLLLSMAVVLGVATTVLISRYLATLEGQFGVQVMVLTAQTDIPAAQPIRDEMLTAKPVPARYLLPGMIRQGEKGRLLGRQLVSAVRSGQLVAESLLSPTTEVDTTPRAFSLLSSGRVIFDDLRAGDRVDVLAVYKLGSQEKVETVMRNLSVLGMKSTEGRSTTMVTLSLTPTQSERLAWFENFGSQIRLLKRS